MSFKKDQSRRQSQQRMCVRAGTYICTVLENNLLDWFIMIFWIYDSHNLINNNGHNINHNLR
ncbi:hypothetical protein Hanom_Chr09g00794871 [Helianthus anomalus]